MSDAKRFLLRLDPRLFAALRRWADDDLRSINAQIEYLLTEQARRAGRLPKRTPRRPRAEENPDENPDQRPDESADERPDEPGRPIDAADVSEAW